MSSHILQFEPYRLSVWKQEWRPTKNGLVDACSNTCFSVCTQSISWRGERRQTETEKASRKDNVLINQFVWSIDFLREMDVHSATDNKCSQSWMQSSHPGWDYSETVLFLSQLRGWTLDSVPKDNECQAHVENHPPVSHWCEWKLNKTFLKMTARQRFSL